MKGYIYLIIIIAFISCKNETKVEAPAVLNGKQIELKYAKGFTIKDFESHIVIEILNPWPDSEKTFRYAIANKNIDVELKSEAFDAVIDHKINKIVVTSTTHIPALDLLNVTETLVGFPGTDYISTTSVRKRIDQGFVKELGKNEGINTEVLLELQPDLVVGFGVDGSNKSFETIKKTNIPVIYNGDWVETSALAKAEWIKFFGALYNKQDEANAIFNKIEADYLQAKQLASQLQSNTTVLSGAMYKDVWYLPNGTSPEAQLLKDANVNYLWKDTTGKGSLALSFEAVFEKGQKADIWISPSYYKSIEALEKSNTHYTKFEAFKNKRIYSFANTEGATGGLLYYELGTARPDLVLKDIIKICHPTALPSHKPFFFNPLQ